MRDGDDHNPFGFDAVNDAEGKATQQEPPGSVNMDRPGVRKTLNRFDCVVDFLSEALGSRLAPGCVPVGGRLRFF